MTDQPPPAPNNSGSLVGTAGKWLSLFGALIAAGQAGTAWLHGYWQAEEEKQKSAQELALAELKDKSELAQKYLTVILDKNTERADRALLLTALSDIDGHPLQRWAQEQYQQYRKDLDRVLEASKQESDAEQQRDSADKQVAIKSAEIEELNANIELVKNDPQQREKLQNERREKSSELSKLTAQLSIAVVTVEDSKSLIDRSEHGLPVSSTANVANEIISLSNKVNVKFLEGLFPENARANIEANAPYLQAALQEFKVSSKQLLATIIATILVYAPNFQPIEEHLDDGVENSDRFRYRGRGYLELTGRPNYEHMSNRLGLGRRLLDSPDDANSPEVASRILAAWFADDPRILPYLTDGAIDKAWERVVGRSLDGTIPEFSQFFFSYKKVLTQL